GDKTPGYSRHLPAIGTLLPEASFLHLIRDGRDVALSLRPQWFAPSREIEELAAHWRDGVETARRDGARCRRYLEVRFEALVLDSERVLREICGWLELPYDSAMLDYPARVPTRLAEMGDQRHPALLVTRERR